MIEDVPLLANSVDVVIFDSPKENAPRRQHEWDDRARHLEAEREAQLRKRADAGPRNVQTPKTATLSQPSHAVPTCCQSRHHGGPELIR